MRSLTRPAIALVAASLLVAGCSSEESASPEEQVCSARAQVQSSVDQVKQDFTDGNFGQAKDDLAQVGTDLEALVTAQKGLAQDKRDQVEPMVTELKSTLSSLSSASSLADLGATLDTALTQLSDVLSTIGTTVECS